MKERGCILNEDPSCYAGEEIPVCHAPKIGGECLRSFMRGDPSQDQPSLTVMPDEQRPCLAQSANYTTQPEITFDGL